MEKKSPLSPYVINDVLIGSNGNTDIGSSTSHRCFNWAIIPPMKSRVPDISVSIGPITLTG